MKTTSLQATTTKNPIFWTGPRIAMLEAISPIITGRDVDGIQLDQMESILPQVGGASPIIKKRRLARILEELVECGTLESAVKPVVPRRVPRPSVLPASNEGFRLFLSLIKIHGYVFEKWIAQAKCREDRYLAFVITLGVEAGMAGRNWIRLLSGLHWKDIGEDGRVEFPIYWLDETKRRSELYFPASAIILLNHIRAEHPDSSLDQPVFVPECTGAKVRARKLERMLEAAYKRLITAIKNG